MLLPVLALALSACGGQESHSQTAGQSQSVSQVLEETRLTLENIDSPGSIFRMNHASNYLSLRGTFNQDKERMIREVEEAIEHKKGLKPEYFRAL